GGRLIPAVARVLEEDVLVGCPAAVVEEGGEDGYLYADRVDRTRPLAGEPASYFIHSLAGEPASDVGRVDEAFERTGECLGGGTDGRRFEDHRLGGEHRAYGRPPALEPCTGLPVEDEQP